MRQVQRPSYLGETAIVGVGYSEISRRSGRSVLSLALDACRNAITDAGVQREEVDGLASFMFMNDSVPVQAVASGLALPGLRYSLDMQLGGQAPCLLVMQAAMAIASGSADVVVVYRALNGRSGQRVGSTEVVGIGGQYRYPIGFTAYPQYVAMWARRYLIEVGATERDLGAVAVAQRSHAQRNPRAMVRQPLDLESYLSAPLVVDPFRIPDCTFEVDGACALVVTSLARARSLPHTPATIRGAAYRMGHGPGFDIGDFLLWKDLSRNFTSLIAEDLWASAGVSANEVECAQIYDCFTSSVLFGVEGLGFVQRGLAGEFIASGETGIGGSLPVNTNGGLLCEGYLHGMNTVAEATLQVQGRAGDRQVPRARACVVTSGAMMDGSALVLTSA
jgi:acetyl-CoA acetyltransferase